MQISLDTGADLLHNKSLSRNRLTENVVTRKKQPLRLSMAKDTDEPADWGPAPARNRKRARRCALRSLHERGLIGLEQLAAAAEIERVFLALSAGLFATARRSEVRSGRPRDLSESTAIAHADRFRPWARALSEGHKQGGPPVLEVVLAVVIDGLSLREIETARRWRHGKAEAYLAEGLERYAAMAGWLRVRQAA